MNGAQFLVISADVKINKEDSCRADKTNQYDRAKNTQKDYLERFQLRQDKTVGISSGDLLLSSNRWKKQTVVVQGNGGGGDGGGGGGEKKDTHIHPPITNTQTHTHARTHTRTHARTHARTHTHTHTCICLLYTSDAADER